MSLFQLAHDPLDSEEDHHPWGEYEEQAAPVGRVPRVQSLTRPEDDYPFDHPTDQLDYPWNHNDGEV